MIYIAISLIAIGVTLRLLAIKKLGTRFTLFIQSQRDIETGGIYRLMRHPSYLGSLFIIAGVAMLSTLAGILTISFFFFMSRICQEEILMHSDKYEEYKKTTGIFSPVIRKGK